MAEPDAPEGGDDARTLWHGRFSEGPSDALLAFTVSLPFDVRLAADDIAGSRAHVKMLGEVGLITPDEASLVTAALERVETELNEGTFEFRPTDEDIHTAVERRVTEIAGDAGAKLHTARSRNDQVALDLRLFARREAAGLRARLLELAAVLVERAGEVGDAVVPGYTHLQRAQPVLLAHHLLAHFWAVARDAERVGRCVDAADVSPLGAGALAGTSLPIDPSRVASELGFSRTFENSLDAVSDRDFVAELLFAAALTQVHLSRLGEEIVLWTSEEFGFARLADEYATGSSMLPQKKNPDVAELARGKAGRMIGHLTALLTTLKGLPLAYNRDLQEDKEPLFDAVDTLHRGAAAMAGLMATVEFRTDRMAEAAADVAGAATDLAEYLVREGLPFREAHAVVGGLVRQSVERGVPMEELVMTEPRLGPEALDLLERGSSALRRTSPGGGGAEPVQAQLEAARAHLGSLQEASG